MQNKHITLISEALQIPPYKIAKTIELLADGATIPFLARYRKETTGSLDEVQLAAIHKQIQKLEELEKRRQTILKAIEEQGKLTDALQQRIRHCYDATELEDIYLPYKKKRKTRASVAREKGLEPLAKILYEQRERQIEQLARPYLNDEVPNLEAALQGARDIIAEWINEDQKVRQSARFSFEKGANIRSKLVKGKEEQAAKYRDYFDFEEPLKRCPSHRLLAIRRGEDEGFLRVSIAPDPETAVYHIGRQILHGQGSATEQVRQALEDSYKRLLAPSIETEFRNSSKELADMEAIEVFAKNLRQLLLAPPLGQKSILAIDPGFRTGCKVVCLSKNGDLLHYTTIFPHPPQAQAQQAVQSLQKLVEQFSIQAIAIGNGTAGRETMDLLSENQFEEFVQLFMVNESGASIYSASDIARQEFPDQDITVRGAVSIGRRLMDPLAELVKIDPKSIGVGQYQHDVNQHLLKESLDRVVESCVNSVGINLNTASRHLLTYVSGLGPVLAQNIVDYRAANGPFKSRGELKKVARLGEKAFEQSAGFLRIRDAANPLDNTAVHPERYAIVQQMSKDLRSSLSDLLAQKSLRQQIDLQRYHSQEVGMPTLKDILAELEKPGLDPRGQAKAIEFDKKIKSMGDLKPGMVVAGIVTNVTNFGAFVDIGVKQDGLVHISELANKFVKNPADVVSLQQEVRVKILEVDQERKRIHLSMKQV